MAMSVGTHGRRLGQHRVDPDHQVDAGGDHGRGVDQRGDRRRAGHGVGQPDEQRELGRLADRADEQQHGDGGGGRRGEAGCAGRSGRRSGSIRPRAKVRKIATMKPKSPMRLVTNAFLPAEALASLGEPEGDEEVRAGADALPAEERDQQVVAEHQHEHREHEQVQVDEELREVRVAVHVADRVQVDQRADAGDEQAHGDRQRVDQEPDVDLEAAGRDPGEQRLREDVVLGRRSSRGPRGTRRRWPRTTPATIERGQPAGQRLAHAPAERPRGAGSRPAAAQG